MRLTFTLIGAVALFFSSFAQNAEFKNADAYNQFGFQLYTHFPKFGNQVFSPFSVYTSLAMTYAGAAGTTATEMKNVLNADTSKHIFYSNNKLLIDRILQKKESEINIANAVWINKDFHLEKDFKKTIEDFYSAKTQQVSFETPESILESKNIINNWVSKKTKTKIPTIIDEGVLSKDTRMVLTNAIYFKADWEVSFQEELTAADTFHVNEDRIVMAKTMHGAGQYYYFSNEKFSSVTIPYKQGECLMHFVLPNELIYDSLNTFLKYEDFKMLVENSEKANVKLAIPKFLFNSDIELSEKLIAMGMYDAFNNGADFSEMTGTKDTRIDKVLHKTMIEVNEKGTEASAATAVVIVRKTTIKTENRDFIANRPFLFYVTDTATGTILFMGNVNIPQ